MGRQKLLTLLPYLVVIMAIAVQCGWLIESQAIVQLHPSFAPMQFNTALCFLLLGLASIGDFSRQQSYRIILALVGTVLATASGLQYIIDLDFGIDNLFVQHELLTKTSHAGRMAPNTSVVFSLYGLAILGVLTKHKNNKLQIFVATLIASALFLTISALFGYLTSLETVYGWSIFTRMALHTALADLLLGMHLFSVWNRINPIFSNSGYQWHTFIALAVGSLLTLALYDLALIYESHIVAQKLTKDARLRTTLIKNELLEDIAKLESIERFFAASNYVDEDEFSTFTKPFLNQDTSILAIDWSPRVSSQERPALEQRLLETWGAHFMQLDSRRTLTEHKGADIYFPVVYTEPIEFPKRAIGFDHYSDPLRTRAMDRAKKLGQPVATEPFQLFRLPQETSSPLDTLIVVPVYKDIERTQEVLGYVVGVFRLSRVVHRAIESPGLVGLGIELIVEFDSGEQQIVYRERPESTDTLSSSIAFDVQDAIAPISRSFQVAERMYTINVHATPTYVSNNTGMFPTTILVACGFVTIITCFYVLHMSSKRLELATTLEHRDRALEAIQIREKRFSQLAESAPIGIFRTDAQGLCEYVNPAWCTMTGLNEEQAKGTGWANSIHPDDRENVFAAWNATINKSRLFNLEFRFQKPDGTVTWVAAKSTPVLREDGTVSGYVGSNFDLTETKELINKLNEATQAKSLFLANMSHEIRTPMNAILGFAKRLLKRPPEGATERDIDSIDTIHRNAKNLLNLINDILDLSKIESGNTSLDVSDFNLNNLCRETIETMLPLAESKALALSLEIPEEVSSIEADQQKLQQVLTNLVSNAIKYTDQGKVEVQVKVEDDLVRISVRDSGIGISKHDQTQLFSSFTQLDAAEHRREGGTGLGLRLAKEYVELHGGDIDVSSVVGQGSTFQVTIPINQSFLHSQSSTGPLKKHGTILCVDDDKDATKLLSSIIADEGFDALVANTHDQALDLLKRKAVDLICLDLMMPDKNGYDLLDSLENSLTQQQVPIVIVSALNESSVNNQKRMRAFLKKPVDEDRLKNILRSLANELKA